MDGDVGRWVLEFLLRNDVPDKIVKKIAVVLPLSDVDSRLKKTLLLRSIESEVSKASLTESLLQNLEIIEELDRDGGIAITDAMRQAYCAVAVECTIKYLEAFPDNKNHSLYFDAIKSIWRGRVQEMEEAAESGEGSEFLTAELKQWRDDIEAALWNKKVSKRLANTNARRIALCKVRAYLAETWKFMGPSFLELVASSSEVKGSHSLRGDKMGDVHEEAATDNPNEGPSHDMGVSESPLASSPVNVFEERLQSSTNRIEGLAASDILELDNAAICTEKMPVAGGNQDSEQPEKRAISSVDASRELGGIDSPPKTERAIQKGKLPLKHERIASCTRHRGVKIIDAKEENPTTLCSKDDSVSCLEAEKLRESLKSSSLELQALAKDPLPDASRKSDTVRSKLAMKGISHEQPLENQSRDVDIPEPNTCRSIMVYEPKKKPSVNWINSDRPSLKERNSSARTYEWDASINKLAEGTPKKRRKAKRWSSLEEETLRSGVKKFGRGNWKSILNFYSEIFDKTGRTEVDLKDKWRNMTR